MTQQTTIVSVDIETVPNDELVELFNAQNDPPKTMKKEETIEAWRIKEMSINPFYAKIVSLNWLIRGGEPQSRWVGEEVFDQNTGGSVVLDEKMLLKKFWKVCQPGATIVGYNVIGFDIPVILNRSIWLGAKPSRDLSNLKPWGTVVIDLMQRLFQKRKFMSLKKVRQIFRPLINIPARYADIEAMEGGEVYDLYNAGKLDELKLYGELDVVTNMEIWRIGNGYYW